MKLCCFHKFLFYGLYFELYSCLIHLLFNNTYLYSLKDNKNVYTAVFLFKLFVLLCWLLSTNDEYSFGCKLTNSSIAMPPVSSFIFPTTNCLNYHSILT